MDTALTKTGLDQVLAKLDAMGARIDYLVARQNKTEELFAEMTPILREVMASATDKLDALDKKGYFAFGKEALGIVDRVIEGFTAEDVRRLGDAIVGILRTVRTVTQPKVLEIASEASAVLEASDETRPIGLLGAVRATRDDEVQKGLAVMMEVMRHVGRAANAVRTERDDDKKAKLAAVLGPRRKAAAAPVSAPPRPAPPTKTIEPSDPAAAWTEDLATKLAAAEGLELDDARWGIVRLARAEFEQAGASPNIRRLTQIANLGTKEIYALFPRAPARTVAKIAGIPKPAGCI